MFDDILGEDKKIKKAVEPKYKVNIKGKNIDLSPSPPLCGNCNHGSHILSNFPDKVLCQKFRRHKDVNYVCRNWELRK